MTPHFPSDAARRPLILWTLQAWDAQRDCWFYCNITTRSREVAANTARELEYRSGLPFRVVRH